MKIFEMEEMQNQAAKIKIVGGRRGRKQCREQYDSFQPAGC